MADQNFRVKRGLEVGVGGTIITAKSTGNVGISSAEPTAKLDVGGDVKATTFVGALTGTATTASNLSRSVTAGSGLSGGGTLTADVTLNVGAGSGITVNADDVQLKNAGSLTNNYLSKWDSANTQLTNSTLIDTGTNIGIGTTNPLQRLQVGTANTLGISTDGKVFVVTSNSDVGIGTTNPTSKLHVIGDARIVGTITATTFVGALTGTATTASNLNRSVIAGSGLTDGGTLTSDVTLNVGAGSGISINADDVQLKNSGSLTGNRVTKWDSGNTQLTNSIITDDGTNIGINSSSPTSRLDVGGNGRFAGVVTATTFIGNLTGTATTASSIASDSDSNTKGGTGAGSSLVASSGTNNTFFGFSAGCRVTTGDYNIALGSLALLGNASGVTGSHNVAIGRCAGADLSSGACNNFLGYFAGHQLVSGSDNNFFGSAAGYANTGGNNNNFLGYYAGRSNNTGSYNNFFGRNAGYSNTTSSNSIAIGKEAGYSNRGSNNIYLGECAGRNNSGFYYTFGSHNVAIGQSAGANIGGGCYNNFIGKCAGFCNTNGNHNNFLGASAGEKSHCGSNNNFLGVYAGRCNYSGSCNNFFGACAGYYNFSGYSNNFFGFCAGYSISGGAHNNFFGCCAGNSNTYGSNNNFLGLYAGRGNISGDRNNFIGQWVGMSNTTGSDNFFGGYRVGDYNNSGCRNIILGKCAGFQNYTVDPTGDDNTFLGEFSGKCNTSGSGNIFLGRFSGCTNTTGSCNIAIGYSAQLPIITGSNQLVIGSGSTSWINGNSSYNVGLGTTNPISKLHVIGDVTATTFVGALTGTATTASNLNRSVIAGSGLTDGGTLTSNVTLNVGAGDGISVAADSVAVDTTVVRTTRTITSGNGLTGGGDLSSDRTLAVGAGSGISVNADDVQLKNAGSLTNNYLPKWDSANTQLTNTNLTYVNTPGSGIGTLGIGTVISIKHNDTSNSGTLSFEGSAGQLLTITNNITSGSIFSVNDSSGIPSIDVNADGTVTLAPYADGNVGIATTRPTSRLHVIPSSTGIAGLFSGTTSSDMVRITQLGSGNALVVEDSENPDSSPFVVGAGGSVGVGTTNPAYIFTVTDTGTPATAGLTNCLADFTTTANSYGQINLRNTSTGTNASSDVIVTADNGSDSTNYIDLGINNSNYSVGSWTINGANDGYLYTSDGNLSIGAINASVAKYISFFTGGTLLSNERMRINATGVGIGTTNPLSKLQVERYGVSTGFGTFSATAGIATDIDTFTISSTDFKTVEYTLHFINGSNTQAQKVLVMQNGTTAYSQEYAIMFEPNQIVSIGATVSSGICKLQATPGSGISGLTTYRIIRQTVL